MKDVNIYKLEFNIINRLKMVETIYYHRFTPYELELENRMDYSRTTWWDINPDPIESEPILPTRARKLGGAATGLGAGYYFGDIVNGIKDLLPRLVEKFF